MRVNDTTIPYGLCRCGCGQAAPIATKNDPRYGWVKGEPRPFIPQHHKFKSPVEYLEDDRGFETPCWIWQRSVNGHGYGVAYVGGTEVYAARRLRSSPPLRGSPVRQSRAH